MDQAPCQKPLLGNRLEGDGMFGKKAENVEGLELEVFVRETIVSIFKAVQDAGAQIRDDPERSGAVNPLWGGEAHLSEHEQEIRFDVTITVGKSNQGDLNPKIKVPSLAELGGKLGFRNDNTKVSRVSFAVPVAFAGTPVAGTSPNPARASGQRPHP